MTAPSPGRPRKLSCVVSAKGYSTYTFSVPREIGELVPEGTLFTARLVDEGVLFEVMPEETKAVPWLDKKDDFPKNTESEDTPEASSIVEEDDDLDTEDEDFAAVDGEQQAPAEESGPEQEAEAPAASFDDDEDEDDWVEANEDAEDLFGGGEEDEDPFDWS